LQAVIIIFGVAASDVNSVIRTLNTIHGIWGSLCSSLIVVEPGFEYKPLSWTGHGHTWDRSDMVYYYYTVLYNSDRNDKSTRLKKKKWFSVELAVFYGLLIVFFQMLRRVHGNMYVTNNDFPDFFPCRYRAQLDQHGYIFIFL